MLLLVQAREQLGGQDQEQDDDQSDVQSGQSSEIQRMALVEGIQDSTVEKDCSVKQEEDQESHPGGGIGGSHEMILIDLTHTAYMSHGIATNLLQIITTAAFNEFSLPQPQASASD